MLPPPSFRLCHGGDVPGYRELSWRVFGRRRRAKPTRLSLTQKLKRCGSALPNISLAHCEKRATNAHSEMTTLRGRRDATIDVTRRCSGSLQSLVEIADQVVGIEWLAQECNRPSIHGVCPHVFIGIASDENNGEAMTRGDQPVLQIKAAQARHIQIGDEARYLADLLGVEKFLGRAKRGNVLAKRLHETFHRLAQSFIVIDNRNRHSALPHYRSAGAQACLSATDAITWVSDRASVGRPGPVRKHPKV